MIRAATFVACACLFCGSTQAEQPLKDWIKLQEISSRHELIPINELVPDDVIRDVKISPDGSHLLITQTDTQGTVLVIQQVPSLVEVFSLTNDRIRLTEWSSDGSRIFIELDNAVAELSLTDHRLAYVAQLDRIAGDYFIGADTIDSSGLLLVRKSQDRFTLVHVDVSGHTTPVYESADRIDQAIISLEPEISFIKTISATGQRILRVDKDRVETILECGPILIDICEPDRFDIESNTLWLRTNVEEDRASLYSWHTERRQMVLTHTDPDELSDIQDVNYINSSPAFVQYYGGYLRNYAIGDHAIPESAVVLCANSSVSCDYSASSGRHGLLRLEAPQWQHPTFYMVDTINNQLAEIVNKPQEFSLIEKYFFTYPSIDGRQINGYLSLPQGRALDQVPLIALIHGGPFARSYANYSALIQLLVNRGAIVFEPNFRGSTGFGRDYLMSSDKDFGDGIVQQDIEFGIKHLLSLGIGDGNNVGIGGTSFGGFSALTGLVYSPDIFKFGFAISAPADLANSLAFQMHQPGFGQGNPSALVGMNLLVADLTDPVDVSRLYDQSPAAQLDQIQSPLFIYANSHDPAVDINHVRDYAIRLAERGLPLVFMTEESGHHGVSGRESTTLFLAAIERFLSVEAGTQELPLGGVIAAGISRMTKLNNMKEFEKDVR